MVRESHRAPPLPTARTFCTMDRVLTFSVLTPMRWILSGLSLHSTGVTLLVLIDGDVIHPHGIFLRHRGTVGQPINPVVERLPLGIRRARTARRGGPAAKTRAGR